MVTSGAHHQRTLGPAGAAAWGYLGPAGTFTESALRSVCPQAADVTAYNTVIDALDAVASSTMDSVVVPLESSVEGGVTATMDTLATGDAFMIAAEILVPVSFVLAVRPGTAITDVTTVATHPQAHQQCRRWIAEHLPGVDFIPTSSTASAAMSIAKGPEHARVATLCAPAAAGRYGLDVAMAGIADNPSAVTRFVVVSRPCSPPSATGSDKTSLVVYQSSDEPGGLLQILDQFASRGINLLRIESRPTGEALGKYCFSLDAEGHIADLRMQEALAGLHRLCRHVTFLGSYPRSTTSTAAVPASHTDDAYRDGHAWVASLLRGTEGRGD